MVLFLCLIAAFDRYIVGEFGSSGTSPEPLFQAGFWAAVFLTVRGVRSRPTGNVGDRSIWNSVEYYSFLFSNVAVLLVALIFNPPWDGAPYSVLSIVFALPSAIRKLNGVLA